MATRAGDLEDASDHAICGFDHGIEIFSLARRLFQVRRSSAIAGVRATLEVLKEELTGLATVELPPDSHCVDGAIPKEWKVHECCIMDDDSSLADAHLTCGELLIPGQSTEEILLSTYMWHPSMGINDVSGPSVTTFLARWLIEQPCRKYSYRVLFLPEPGGSLAYFNRHPEMIQSIVAGFNVSSVGDDCSYSYLPSRTGDTLADDVIMHVLDILAPDYKRYTLLDRGSGQWQCCIPNIDVPLMRTKYDTYPGSHTSPDDMASISPQGLFGPYNALLRCLQCIEWSCRPRCLWPCEPQLGKRGLYPDLSRKGSNHEVKRTMNVLAYSDGRTTLLEIARTIGVPAWEVADIVKKLAAANVLEVLSD